MVASTRTDSEDGASDEPAVQETDPVIRVGVESPAHKCARTPVHCLSCYERHAELRRQSQLVEPQETPNEEIRQVRLV